LLYVTRHSFRITVCSFYTHFCLFRISPKFDNLFEVGVGFGEENFLYVKDVNASGGKEHGISDITFKLRKDPISGPVVSSYVCGEKPEEPMIDGDITYFISVKRFTQERSAKYYDIGDLYTYIGKKHPGAPFNLCICCRNRGEFLKRMTASKSDYLTTSVDKLYGFDDTSDKENPGLLQVFERYRSSVFSNMAPIYKNVGDKEDFNVKEWITKHIPEKVPVKPALSLYFHQELIVESVIHRINEQKTAGSKDREARAGRPGRSPAGWPGRARPVGPTVPARPGVVHHTDVHPDVHPGWRVHSVPSAP
jgi:hypothetical protein